MHGVYIASNPLPGRGGRAKFLSPFRFLRTGRAGFLLLLLTFLLSSPAAPAKAAGGGEGKPAPASPVIDREVAAELVQELQDPQKRARLIAELEVLAAAHEAARGQPAAPLPLPLAPNSLGAQLLVEAMTHLQEASRRFTRTVQSVTDFQDIADWFNDLLTNPVTQARLFAASWRLALIVAIGALADFFAARLLRRPRLAMARLEEGEEEGAQEAAGAPDEPLPPAGEGESAPIIAIPLSRLPLVLLRFGLEVVPALVMLAFVYGLLSTPLAGTPSVQVVIMAIVDAMVVVQIIMAAVRALFSPDIPALRVFAVGDEAARAIVLWVRRLAAVTTFGYAGAEAGLVFGLDPDAHDALLKLVALVNHVMLIVIVWRYRTVVANWIAPRSETHHPLATLRHRLARLWHLAAILLLLASWMVWAVGVAEGYRLLIRVTVLTLLVFAGSRALNQLVMGSLDRLFHVTNQPVAISGLDIVPGLAGLSARARRYYRMLRLFVSFLISALTVIVLLQVWGFGAFDWFSDGAIGGRLVSALVTILLVFVAVLAIWEGVNELIQRHINHLTARGLSAPATRLRTLLPMIRAALALVLFLIAGPVALSEIGVNIAPLLAGAGIVGVAIGFGSQKLVQDLITGVFLLLENAMQVGDWVTVAGVSGSVEALSVRTIRLRADDGSVHIIPFSAVTTVNNANRGLGNASVSVSVPSREDPDRIFQILREIAAEMRKDPAYQRGMLSDLQLWGVDRIEGSVMTIAGQIVCTDQARWSVQREFHRRLRQRFSELGIELANPTQTVVVLAPERWMNRSAAAESGAPSALPENAIPSATARETVGEAAK